MSGDKRALDTEQDGHVEDVDDAGRSLVVSKKQKTTGVMGTITKEVRHK